MKDELDLRQVGAAIVEASGMFADGEDMDWARDVDLTAARKVADVLDVGRRFLTGGVVSKALEEVGREDLLADLRVGRQLLELRRLPEFEPLLKDGVSVEVVFDTAVSATNGAALRCKAVKVAEVEQDTADREPYRVLVSLPVWLGLDETQRQAALHAALCNVLEWHLGEKRGRVSVHPATLARFGPQTPAEAEVLAHAMSRPALAAEVRRFGFDGASGQGLLFGDGGKVDVPSNAPAVVSAVGRRL